MQKIAEINAATEASSYLYEKDVYDPDKDPELREDDGAAERPVSSDGFELPDFLKDIEDGIIKIQ